MSRKIIALSLPFLAMLHPGMSLAETVTDKASGAPLETMAVGSALQMLLGLVVVILIIFGCAWLFKRYGRLSGGFNEQMKIIGGLSLGPRERLVLVQIGPRQLLVGVAPGCIQTLHVLEEGLDMGVRSGSHASFMDRFSDALKKQRSE